MKRSDLEKTKADIEHGLKTTSDIPTRRYLEKKYHQIDRMLKEKPIERRLRMVG